MTKNEKKEEGLSAADALRQQVMKANSIAGILGKTTHKAAVVGSESGLQTFILMNLLVSGMAMLSPKIQVAKFVASGGAVWGARTVFLMLLFLNWKHYNRDSVSLVVETN